MRYPYALFLLALTLSTGCASVNEAVEPKMVFAEYFVTLLAVTTLLASFSGRELKRSLLDGLQYTSALAVAAAPIHFLMVSSEVLAFKIGLSGLVGLGISTILLRLERRFTHQVIVERVVERSSHPDGVKDEDVSPRAF